jgi:hypothetical protein
MIMQASGLRTIGARRQAALQLAASQLELSDGIGERRTRIARHS